MIQTRPTNFTFSPDSAKAGTSYAFLGLSIVLATNGSVATQFDAKERAHQNAVFRPSVELERPDIKAQHEVNALQRLWQSIKVATPKIPQVTAVVVRHETKPFIWVDEPAELEDEILFTPPIGKTIMAKIVRREKPVFVWIDDD